jgi:hypothetical protein
MQPLQTSLGGVAIHSSFSEFGAPSAPSTWKDAAAALNRTKGAGLPSSLALKALASAGQRSVAASLPAHKCRLRRNR